MLRVIEYFAKSLKVMTRLSSYLYSIVTMSLCRTVSEIMAWPWNLKYGSFKVIGNGTIRYIAYEFLLAFHSNYGPILYRSRDKTRYSSEIPIFHTTAFDAALGGTSQNIAISFGVEKLERWWKSLKMGLLVLTQYTNVTDSKTDGRTDRQTPHDGIDRA